MSDEQIETMLKDAGGAYLKVRGGVGSGVRNGGKEIIKTIISPS
jgi:hypothetical protein